MGKINVKRIYEKPANSDGNRVLVDRLWPRGVSKEAAKLDEWLKEIGPTDELRKWFGHEKERFPEFKSRYKEQLKSKKRQEALKKLKKLVKEKRTTLLTGARETKYNHVQVLREILEDESK